MGNNQISLRELIEPLARKLAPDQVALFEPLSAMTLLNIEQPAFAAIVERFVAGETTAEDVPTLAAINHEGYHFAQAGASGYMLARQRTAMRVFTHEKPLPRRVIDRSLLWIINKCRKLLTGDDPELNARLARMLWMAEEGRLLAILDARAAPGDHSLEGALFPHLFVHFAQRAGQEQVANGEGLSILGLLEGSAVIHSHLLMYGGERAADSIPAELATLPPVYGQLLAVTRRMAGDRCLELALPATALALCYARPHDAYCALVPMIAAAPKGQALARGRDLFEAPPAIASAGAWLGDAPAQRETDDSYVIYDPFIDALRSRKWGVGSYELMADPKAMNAIGSFPLGIVTRSQCHAPFDTTDKAVRLLILGTVLRSRSRRRDRRDYDAAAALWAHDALHRLLDHDAH